MLDAVSNEPKVTGRRSCPGPSKYSFKPFTLGFSHGAPLPSHLPSRPSVVTRMFLTRHVGAI